MLRAFHLVLCFPLSLRLLLFPFVHARVDQSRQAPFPAVKIPAVRRGLFFLLAVLLSGWLAPTAEALTRKPTGPTPHYDEAVAVVVVVLGDGITMDTDEGAQSDPLSLHKYLYCANDPVNRTDLTGNTWFEAAANGRLVHKKIGEHFRQSGPGRISNRWISTILGPTRHNDPDAAGPY